jgi:hypothetical protein
MIGVSAKMAGSEVMRGSRFLNAGFEALLAGLS